MVFSKRKEYREELKRIKVLIPDGEVELLLFQVKSCLAKSDQVDIYIMSNRKYAPSRFSRFIKHFEYYPKTKNEEEWVGHINDFLQKHSIDVIMPIYEKAIRILIKNKHLLSQPNKLVKLPCLELFDTAIDKIALANHMLECDIPHPKSFMGNSLKNEESLLFPVIAKPLVSGGGEGIKVLKNQSDFDGFSSNLNLEKDYLVQEYISGYDIDCSVLCDNGEIKAYTIQKGVLFRKNIFAPSIVIQFLYEKRLYDVVEKLMQSLNWSGIAHIDLRYDSKTDAFKVIEVNPRYWETLECSLVVGVNFPTNQSLLHMNRGISPSQYMEKEVMTLRGFAKRVRKNPLFVFRLGYIRKYSTLPYIFEDPLPSVVKFYKVLEGAIGRFLRLPSKN